MDWDRLNELEARFWGSIPLERSEMLLENIRVLEGEYPAKVQQMVEAGRYAGSLKQNIDGFEGTYYELEDHPRVIAYLVRESRQTEAMVKTYLRTPYWKRRALAKDPEQGSIQDALEKAQQKKTGILWGLKNQFISQAPVEWVYAMYNAGYKYQGYTRIKDNIERRAKETNQPNLPEIDYEALYRKAVARIAA